MSVDSWTPAPESSDFSIEREALERCIALAEEGQWEQLASLVDQTWQEQQRPLMKLGKEAWFNAAENLSNDQVEQLVRFFTVAEMKLSGWEAGAESPVIWLVKVLRRRKAPPSKELLLWIKANSDNRFIPNGAL